MIFDLSTNLTLFSIRNGPKLQAFIPDDFDLTSEFEKQSKIKQPGIVQYSKVSRIVKNKRIKEIVYKK